MNKENKKKCHLSRESELHLNQHSSLNSSNFKSSPVISKTEKVENMKERNKRESNDTKLEEEVSPEKNFNSTEKGEKPSDPEPKPEEVISPERDFYSLEEEGNDDEKNKREKFKRERKKRVSLINQASFSTTDDINHDEDYETVSGESTLVSLQGEKKKISNEENQIIEEIIERGIFCDVEANDGSTNFGDALSENSSREEECSQQNSSENEENENSLSQQHLEAIAVSDDVFMATRVPSQTTGTPLHHKRKRQKLISFCVCFLLVIIILVLFLFDDNLFNFLSSANIQLNIN